MARCSEGDVACWGSSCAGSSSSSSSSHVMSIGGVLANTGSGALEMIGSSAFA